MTECENCHWELGNRFQTSCSVFYRWLFIVRLHVMQRTVLP